ncbi:expressed unknown protein [Seminavis robusta]|uniref:Uncharacterized protein n=1 Tax=Seminavis robusta TaxID=568900 RepID=A0A9N8H8Q0_9STRA|nr:expressed unknown protein [Seminavis robusta]|eukprot:Sro97_g049920.1 n/a (584) ;mRNA; f:41845-43596
MKRRRLAVHVQQSSSRSRTAVLTVASLSLFACFTLPWMTLQVNTTTTTQATSSKTSSFAQDQDDTRASHGSHPHFQHFSYEFNTNATRFSSDSKDTSGTTSSSNSSASDPPIHQQHSQLLQEPWDIVDQYIEWHSQEAVRQDPFNRSYALAFYSCPLQVGNRWHHFMNSFLWSILTNRTILWQYWDKDTCKKYGKHYDSRICTFANKITDCDTFLDREPWMTSYQQWKQEHPSLADTLLVRIKKLSYWTTHSPYSKPGRGFLPYQNSSKDTQHQLGIDARSNQYPIVVFPQMLGKTTSNHFVQNQTIRNHLLHTQWARQTAQVLYKYGSDLLFGLLFHSTFALSEQLIHNTTAMVVPNPNYNMANDNNNNNDTAAGLQVSKTCSIALHSRHTNTSILGDDISEEIACIEQLWQQYTTSKRTTMANQECDLYIMTDRPYTLHRLIDWCHNYYNSSSSTNATAFPCRRVIHAMHEKGVSYVPEHGPYAGVGFLQDLAVLQQSALSSIGIVGGKRSSTDLLTEWIEYERMVEILEEGGDDGDGGTSIPNDRKRRRRLEDESSLEAPRPIPELPRCILPGSSRNKRR